MEVTHSMAISVTSYAKDRGHDFPFVTLPDFEARAQKALALSGAESLSYSPLVEANDRAAWENYTVTHGPTWIRNTLDYHGLQEKDIPNYATYIHDGQMVRVGEPVFNGNEALSGK